MLFLRKTQDVAIRHLAARFFPAGNRYYSKKDYDSSDDEKIPKQTKITKEQTEHNLPSQENRSPHEESSSAKLNRLLASMQTADDQINFSKRIDIIAKPGEANKKRKLLQKQQIETKDIFAAAKKVASMLGDEKKQQQQTESELLTRLLGGKTSSSDRLSEDQKLLANEGNISLSELIVGMKIDRSQEQVGPASTRSLYVRRSLAAKKEKQYDMQKGNFKEKRSSQRMREPELYTGSVKFSDSEPLGIFSDPSALEDSIDLLPTWSYLHEQALKMHVSHPPSNYFDKLARWTEQGKIWRFPIDNEQDWLDEKDVDFTEHIFLEQHLEGWCPNAGPVRHFMELVCVGLSKNPYITANEKKDHIMWYKNYFESKKDILKELMSKNPKKDKHFTDQQQKHLQA